jgi:hypothetical protein
MVSKVKGAPRSAAARTTEAVYAAFASALHDVTLEDIAGGFRHRAAYAMQLRGALIGDDGREVPPVSNRIESREHVVVFGEEWC